MKVLVTGGCGFLGSHICEFYKKRGDEAISFDNLTKYELMRTGYKVRGARLHNWNILKGMGVSLVKANRLTGRIAFRQCAVGGRNGTVYTSESKSDFEVRKSRDARHTVRVRSYSLDSLVRSLGIGSGAALKVDIEGGEYETFAAASDATLRRFSGIHVECHYGYSDIIRRLRAAGFEVRHTRPIYQFKGLSHRAMVMCDVIAVLPGKK